MHKSFIWNNSKKEKAMFLTVFTPTYNRAYTLGKLYQSLCVQTDKDFEWLIVDDGSLDDTKVLVAEWIKEGKVKIRYIYQENAGKQAAHNLGVEKAQGELFICVDSDDYLSKTAVSILKQKWQEVENDCIGILAYKVLTTGKFTTKLADKEIRKTTLKKGYDRYGLTGDTALIFKSEILKKHNFPIFPGEKFIPEGYLYDRLDQEGPLWIVREGIYVCEYLADGYTANIKKMLYYNPQGYFAYIEQRLKIDKGIKAKFLDSIRYMAMAIAHKKKRKIKDAVYPFWAIMAYFPGWIMYRKGYRRYQK